MSSLTHHNRTYSCPLCLNSWEEHNGYIDFMGDYEFYAGEVSQKEIKDLLDEIDNLGYTDALERFLIKNPSLRGYITDKRRADWIFHCYHNITRCLDVGSGLGNISEILAKNFREIYSLEAVKERIEFQRRRYLNANIDNIVLVRSNAIELPFPDEYFDLVVCNGVLEWIGMLNTSIKPRDAQLKFLSEIRRILSHSGCLYIGIENRFGLQYFLGQKDHSGLPFTSLMPRDLANQVSKTFGRAGGVYGDKEVRQKERGYYTYTYSLAGYKSLFQKAGFYCEAYWTMSSYNEPFYSGRIEDANAIKAAIKYLKLNSEKFKYILSLVNLIDRNIMKFAVRHFVPSFLLYCYKDKNVVTFDDNIVRQTSYKSFLTVSEGNGVIYILFNDRLRPAKVVHILREGLEFDINSPLIIGDSTPSPRKNRIWIENYVNGRKLDPTEPEQATKAIEWLIGFQKGNPSDPISRYEADNEISEMFRRLSSLHVLENTPWKELLSHYNAYVSSISVNRTPEHGDFWYGNILYEKSVDRINVIDWEFYDTSGGPFFDFLYFILNGMLYPDYSAERFASNMTPFGKFFEISKGLHLQFEKYLRTEFSIQELLPYAILRFLDRKSLRNNILDRTSSLYISLLSKLADT